MPSKQKQLKRLLLKVVVVVLWIPLTGSISHDRTYGDLKRLHTPQLVVMLLPLAVFALVGSYVLYVIPEGVVLLASGVALFTIVLAVALYSLTVAISTVLDWRLSKATPDDE